MAKLPLDGQEMLELFRRSISAPGKGADVDEEELALLAEGRIGELSAEDRSRVLRAVAADESLQDLVVDVRRIYESESISTPQRGHAFWANTTRAVFALAACAMLALGTWRLLDPPATGGAGTIGQSSVNLPGASPSANWHVTRDRLLIASGGIALILAIPVAWWALRRR